MSAGVHDSASRTVAKRIEQLGFDPAKRELERVELCNLCESSRFVEAARRDRYGYEVALLICVRCGLGQLSPRLTRAEYAAFYRDVYRPLVSAYHGRRIDAETVQAEQREYAADLVPFLRSSFERLPASVLDVGGSTGVVAAAVRDAFGAQPTVLDPSPDELGVAREAGIETVSGFAEGFESNGRRWDLVLLCQTIDHLLDVASTLTALRKVVAPGGRMFVDVVDVGFIAARRGSIEAAVKVDHPYYLTRPTALAYFDRCGLSVVSERLSDDGHRGFLLVPGDVREPDWAALGRAASAFLAEIWRLRATRD